MNSSSYFSYKDIYIEDGRKVLEVNILRKNIAILIVYFVPLGGPNIKQMSKDHFLGRIIQ